MIDFEVLRMERTPTMSERPVQEFAESPLEFQAIYKTWFKQVLGWVRCLGGPEADREDLAQDVFVIVHRRLAEFDGENTGGWLYQITRHRVRDFRKRLWFRRRGLETSSEQLCASGTSPLDFLETKQRWRRMDQALEALSTDETSALLLFEWGGLSGQEIAAQQGISLNTTWSRIRRARQKLNARVHKDERWPVLAPALVRPAPPPLRHREPFESSALGM